MAESIRVNPPTGGTSNPQHDSQPEQESGIPPREHQSFHGERTQRSIANDPGNFLPDIAVADRGEKGKNWQPPAGQQGMSNRPDDEVDASAGGEFLDDALDNETRQADGKAPQRNSSQDQAANRERERIGNDPAKFKNI